MTTSLRAHCVPRARTRSRPVGFGQAAPRQDHGPALLTWPQKNNRDIEDGSRGKHQDCETRKVAFDHTSGKRLITPIRGSSASRAGCRHLNCDARFTEGKASGHQRVAPRTSQRRLRRSFCRSPLAAVLISIRWISNDAAAAVHESALTYLGHFRAKQLRAASTMLPYGGGD